MEYISIDDIAKEVGINRNTVYKKAHDLDIDTSNITPAKKKLILKACEDTIARKKEANEFLEDIKNVKVEKSDEISGISGSTLEQRLMIAKKEFDNVSKSLMECQVAIDTKGTILMNGNNGTISSNPAVKTKCELLKQQNALQKTISDLENSLKMTVAITKDVIDDE